MGTFTNKIDFAVLVMVKNANPNGDPLNGNRPRETYDGYGEISDVCIKRKIRNRLQDMGEKIFVQSDERSDDGCKSLADRTKRNEEMQKALKSKDRDAYAKVACETWIDVRSFGQVFAFKDDSVSVGVRGPVSIHSAFSVSPISIDSMQITKSVNSETKEKKSSDTMALYYAKLAGDPAALKELDILDCMECRSCEYICSSKIPLVDIIRAGKIAVRGMK